jgi:hypothetical protein
MAAPSTKKATAEKKPKAEADAETKKPEKIEKSEVKYGASELANAARARFKVPPEVVQVALKLAKKQEATLEETKKIVKEFMERKVN